MQDKDRLIYANNLASDISSKVSSMAAAGCDSKWVYNKILECLEKAPAVNARPVVYTQWDDYSTSMMECRVCKKHVPRHKYKFCPECGSEVRNS